MGSIMNIGIDKLGKWGSFTIIRLSNVMNDASFTLNLCMSINTCVSHPNLAIYSSPFRIHPYFDIPKIKIFVFPFLPKIRLFKTNKNFFF